MIRWRRAAWAALLMLGALALGLAGCSSAGGGDGGAVDDEYDFGAAGVQPGVDSRDAGLGRLRGTVTDTAGEPASGVRVTLLKLTESRQAQVGSAVTFTGTDGTYVIGNVPPGSFRLRMEDQTSDVTVQPDHDTTVNFSGATTGSPGNEDQCDGDDPNLPEPQYKWTVIVYMNADNDLEPYGVDDVNEMEMLPASDDVAIVVLMDRIRGFDTSNGNWTDARRFKIVPDDDDRTMTSALSASQGGQAEVLGELDMGNAATLTSFLDYAMRTYPAERYLVDIWNHGAGWRKRSRGGDGPISRGVSYDDSANAGAGSNIETEELAGALNAPACIDVLAMDASLMQMAEVSYQIRNNALYIVGSEESPPGEGYPYDDILQILYDNPDTTPETLARNIVNVTADTVGSRESITQSALRSSQLAALRGAIDEYAGALLGLLPGIESELLAARTAAQRYGGGSSLYEGYRDLVDFLDEVESRVSDTTLATAAQGVRDALQAALVAERHTGSTLSSSNGMSIFCPNSSDWFDLRGKYRRLAYGLDTRWDELWDAVHGIQ